MKNLSETVGRILKPHRIGIAHKPDNTLRGQLMNPKDKVHHNQQSGVIYRINCNDCPQYYVGEYGVKWNTGIRCEADRGVNIEG